MPLFAYPGALLFFACIHSPVTVSVVGDAASLWDLASHIPGIASSQHVTILAEGHLATD